MFSNRNKCFIENVVLTGISSLSLLQVLQNIYMPSCIIIIIIMSAMRPYFKTYKRALLIINTRHFVTHCSSQNKPENIQNSGLSTAILSEIHSIPFSPSLQWKHHSNQTNPAISALKPGSNEWRNSSYHHRAAPHSHLYSELRYVCKILNL